jgi:hypothetical protein
VVANNASNCLIDQIKGALLMGAPFFGYSEISFDMSSRSERFCRS